MIYTIESFLKGQDRSNLALVINGEWGSGKTYFVENNLPEISKSLNLEYIYVSLNGISSLTDLLTALFVSRLGALKSLKDSKLGKISTSLLRIGFNLLGKNNPLVKFGPSDIQGAVDLLNVASLEGTVVVLDDLERVLKDVDIVGLLGGIHSNIISKGAKVIFVCDESKVQNKDDYQLVKEKYIGWTINYHPSTRESYNSLIITYNEEYRKFLDLKKSFLLDVFAILEVENLRTVLFFFDIVYQIFDRIKRYDQSIVDSILYSIFVHCVEYKKGTIENSDLTSLPPYLSNDHEKWGEGDDRLSNRKKYTFYSHSRLQGEEDYYFTFFSHSVLLKSIFLEEISNEEFNGFINGLTDFVEAKCKSPYVKKISRLKFFWLFSTNEELGRIINEILDAANKGLLTLDEYTFFVRTFYDLKLSWKYLPVDVKNIKKVIFSSVEKIKDFESSEPMYLESINNSIEEIKEHSEDLYQKLIDKGEWIFDIVQKKKVNKLIERIETRSAKKNDYYSLIVETKPEELYNFLDRNFIDKQILDCLFLY